MHILFWQFLENLFKEEMPKNCRIYEIIIRHTMKTCLQKLIYKCKSRKIKIWY